MNVKNDHFVCSEEEYSVLKEEDYYVQRLLGVNEGQFPSLYNICKMVEVESRPAPLCEEDIFVNGIANIVNKENLSSKCTRTTADGEGKYNKVSFLTQNLASKCEIELDPSERLKELNEKFNYSNLPEDLQKLLHGIYHGLPNSYAIPNDNKPEWLNMEKFKAGQVFAQKYFTSLNVSDMLSLVVLFTFPDVLEALIFTGNSGTPFTAFRRYLTTALRVKSWTEHDLWSKDNPGYRNLKTVRALHLNVSKRLNSTKYEELEDQLTLKGSSSGAPVWSDKKEALLRDFQSCCPFTLSKPLDNRRPGKIFVSQLDMSITQFANVGLLIAYPDKFGAGNATREELEGFIHMWRGIGYLLGIEDEFNFCAGTLEEVVQRSRHVIDFWVKPNFQNITEDWEHMSRCLQEGLSYLLSSFVKFEPTMLYLFWVLDIPADNLEETLSWEQVFAFSFIKFILNNVLRLSGMLKLHNSLLRFVLTRASSMSPRQLNELEKKTYKYQTKKPLKSLKSRFGKGVSKSNLLALLFMARFLI